MPRNRLPFPAHPVQCYFVYLMYGQNKMLVSMCAEQLFWHANRYGRRFPAFGIEKARRLRCILLGVWAYFRKHNLHIGLGRVSY